MKILIIQTWMRLGGAELISYHLAKELRLEGHDVSLACVFAMQDELPEDGAGVEFRLPHPRISQLCSRYRWLFLVIAPWVLLYLAWKHSKDVDLINPHNFPASWVAVLVGGIRRVPVVWTCNEPPERIPFRRSTGPGLGDVLGWLVASSWLDRVLMRRVSAMYVPSDRTKMDVERRYGTTPSTVRIGVDAAFFTAHSGPQILESLGIQSDCVLLTVGKLHPQKNQIACLRAMPAVIESQPDAKLLLAGDGPWRSELENESMRLGLDENVIFLGHRNQTEIRSLYTEANVNLFPAINQSWGLTPFEALCAGTISVVSNETGAAEIVLGKGIGLVCDPSPSAIAEAILDALERTEFVENSIEKGKSYVLNHLTWSNYAKSVREIFEGVLAEANPLSLDHMARQGNER